MKLKDLASFPALLICLGVFQACICGGYILNDQTRISDSLIGEIFSGSNAPLLAHAIFGLPILAALAWMLVARRIQQVPGQTFTAIWLLFFLFLGVSSIFSSFRVLSLSLWLEWLIYGAATFAVVACVGRSRGPVAVLSSVVAGTAFVALMGIREYAYYRPSNPSWRIFAGWVNPNATAALLLIGFFIAVGLCLSSNRLPALLTGAAAALIAFAIFLTGSKGAVSLGLPIGTVALALCLSRSRGTAMVGLLAFSALFAVVLGAMFVKNVGWLGLASAAVFAAVVVFLTGETTVRRIQATRIASCYAASFLLVLLLTVTGPSASAPSTNQTKAPIPAASPIARIAQGGGTQEQSATFRLNLWTSSIHLIKSRPITGYGMGTYRYESGRAGLSTSTLFAHNVLLQLWSECGLIATLLFVAGIFVWFRTVLKNHNNLSVPRLGPFAGIVSAIVALLVHSTVDSDLYYFGIGLVFFVLLGVGLLISVDSVAPEFVPRSVRLSSAFGILALATALIAAGQTDDMKSRFRADLESPSGADLETQAEGLRLIGQWDGDADYLVARYDIATQKGGTEPLQLLALAYRLSPSEKIARFYATIQQQAGQSAAAIGTLRESLDRDPNNLITLSALTKLQESAGDTAGAIDTAQRLVDVEKTPYFTVRSIPESVPTETYFARFDVLAPHQANPKNKADLLAAGVSGMLEYAHGTAQIIFQNSEKGKNPELRMPGYDSLTEATEKIQKTRVAAQQAEQIYGTLGDRAAAAEMETDSRLLAEDLDAISPK